MTQIFLINQFSGTWSENLTQHAGQVTEPWGRGHAEYTSQPIPQLSGTKTLGSGQQNRRRV